MTGFLEKINNIIWGPATVILILVCGIYFTLRSGFFQIKYLKKSIRTVLSKNDKSSFRALSAALAGTIGTGNIAGVATSIALGGPGAVFWMIISAFFGMMTKFAEVVLAVKFRTKTKFGYSGGPMYYIENGLGLRGLGILFAILLALSAFGIGNMVQSNSVSLSLYDTFGTSKKVSGLLLMFLCFFIIMGGAKKILSATEIIVPVMAAFYLLGTLIFLVINIENIPNAFKSIFTDAFSGTSIIGGCFGFAVSRAVKFGISRGVFTNEAGLGSSSVAHASARVKSAAEQGLWGIFEVFFDTVIMCTLTALVILTANGGEATKSGLSGMELTISAFETVFGSFGGIFISVSLLFFAVATIFGWGLYGEKAILYLTGHNRMALFIYKIFYTLAIYVGAIMSLDSVWLVADIVNGLMVFPNIIALFMLRKYVLKEIKSFRQD